MQRNSARVYHVRAIVFVACFIVIWAFASPSLYGQGGPPLLTDDPGTPGDGHWEINLAFAVAKLQSQTLFEAPLLDINYGIGERIQLKYEVPWVFLHEEGFGTQNGLGNSEIGIKYRFLDENPHGLSLSVYPQLSFNNPTSSDERGLVDPGVELLLPFQIARSFGQVEMSFEMGYAYVEHSIDEWTYGLASAWPLMECFELVGEIHGTATRTFDEDVLVFNLGGILKIHRNVNLLFSSGRSFRKPSAAESELLGYVGVQLNF